MNNRAKSRERATIHQKRRESNDKNSVAIVKIVSQLDCVSQNSDALDSRKKSWDRFEENDSRSLRYAKQVSGKRKDHRLEKYKSRILIREVRPYAVTFEDRSQEEIERQQRCARSKAWNLAKNMYKLMCRPHPP